MLLSRYVLIALLILLWTTSFGQIKLKQEIEALDSKFIAAYRAGAIDSAIYYSKKGLLKAEELAVDSILANSLNNLAVAYYYAEQLDKVEPLYLKVLALDRKQYGDSHPYYAITLNNLAQLYIDMLRFSEAESLLLESKRLRAAIWGEKTPQYATVLVSLGVLYTNLEAYIKADQLIAEASAIFQQVHGTAHPAYGTTLTNRANNANLSGDYQAATRYYKEAANSIAESLGKNHPSYVHILHNQGLLALRQEQFSKALRYFRKMQGRVQHHSFQNSILQIQVANSLAKTFLAKSSIDSARYYLHLALAINANRSVNEVKLKNLEKYHFQQQQRLDNSLNILLNIAWETVKSPNASKEALLQYLERTEQVLRIKEKQRAQLRVEEDQLKKLEERSSWLERALDVAHRLESAYTNRAFSLAEQNKAILLSDFFQSQKAFSWEGIPDSLKNREIYLADKLAKLQKQLLEDKASSTITEKALQETRAESERLLYYLKQRYPSYHQLKYQTNFIKLEALQKQLAPNALVLEYVLGENTCFVFAITAKHKELFALDVSLNEVNSKVEKLRDFFGAQSSAAGEKESYTQLAHELYQLLLAPILSSFSKEQLIIIPDGSLAHLPFETLLTQAALKEQNYAELPYLLKKFSISYQYSCHVWQEQNKRALHRAPDLFLGMAGSYSGNDLPSSQRTARSLRDLLEDLPAAKEEVEAISHLLNGTYQSGHAATEHYFKHHASQYQIIHLALHGLLDKNQPLRSNLAFSLDTIQEGDGFLHAYEITQLPLNADLVTLSACETGYGKFAEGEGVMSLARSFMYAGVPSLVVSLWKVNDQSTAILMEHFYKNLKDGLSKPEALRAAKLHYLENASPLSAHPKFWSPFIQIGNTKALFVPPSPFFWPLLTLGALFLLALLFWLLQRYRANL